MSLRSVAAFVDTNIFLHYRPLNELDWCSILQAGEVSITVAPVVTQELEQRKTLHQSKKMRERAETALHLLNKYLDQKPPRIVHDRVSLNFLVHELPPEAASSRGLNVQIADDRLISTLLRYREDNAGAQCVVVTNDLGLKVKAHHYEIEVITPSKTLQLPSEPDPLERKNKQLEAELLQYKSREPVLDMQFRNRHNYSLFQLVRPSDSSDPEPEIQSKLAAAKEKCQPVELRPKREKGALSTANNPFAQIVEVVESMQDYGREFYENYNIRVGLYHRTYEQFLRDTFAFKTLGSRTVELNLIVGNAGTCPAEDVHVILHFPDGFLLYDDEDPPKQPKEPAVPSKEINLMQRVEMPYFRDIHSLPQFPNPNLPNIRKTNSYDVTFDHKRLQHRFIWKLAPLYVAFDSWESANSFSIDYTIHAGNMIQEQRGELNVIIEKS